MKLLSLVLAVGAAVAVADSLACPFSPDHPLIKLRPQADRAIVRIHTNGPPGCTDTGTGFFINAAGDVLTAGHLLAEHCTDENTSIKVNLAQGAAPVEGDEIDARVIARSSLDVLVLRLDRKLDRPRQFLTLAALPADESAFRNRCVLVASHYEEQFDTYSTFAEIASVSLIGNQGWALSGEGFNATRSGSPVILEDGRVIAVFLSRPGDPANRDAIIQSRAGILPLKRIPKSEVDLATLAVRPGTLAAFPGGAATAAKVPVKSSFGISLTANGFRTDPGLPTFLISRNDGELTRSSSLQDAALAALLSGSSIVREVVVSKQIVASPGFQFDPSTLSIRTDSLNPRKAPLPLLPCTRHDEGGCYMLASNRQSMELRFKLYPGVDGRRSWIDGEVHVMQRPN